MIGIFDSGLGGLTILRTLAARFPDVAFTYLGDHAHVPYGNRSSDEVVSLTRDGVEALFRRGAKLVLLGCNTATAVAARQLQQTWLPGSGWTDHNLIGIVAPTVEAATQTPWAVTTPQSPQKDNTDTIAVFGTTRTIESDVYAEEISKRCPRVRVVQQACAHLAGAIETEAAENEIEGMVRACVQALLERTGGGPVHSAILGCTHYPLIEHLFRKHLPARTAILSQPDIVADSLDDYLKRHQSYLDCGDPVALIQLLTTGDPAEISARARVFWPHAPAFEHVGSAEMRHAEAGP